MILSVEKLKKFLYIMSCCEKIIMTYEIKIDIS